MKKKSFFTLIEVIITVSLFSIIVIAVLQFFSHFTLLETHLEKNRAQLLERQYAHTELQHIFSHLLPSSLLHDKEHPVSLFTLKPKESKHTELFFFFDQGIDLESQFCGPTYGKIFIDASKNLILTIWPYPLEKEFPSRSKILLKNVESMRFEFLSSNLGDEPKKLWPKKLKTAPYLMKITLKQNQQMLSFAFFLGSKETFFNFEEPKAKKP